MVFFTALAPWETTLPTAEAPFWTALSVAFTTLVVAKQEDDERAKNVIKDTIKIKNFFWMYI